MNSGGPGVYFRGFGAIFAHCCSIFAYFEVNIPPESAGVHLFKQACLFGEIRYVDKKLSHKEDGMN